MSNRTSQLLFAAVLLLCSAFAHPQVTVAIAPNPHPQFVDASGKPLASGFLFTYTAGTTSNLNTYADSSGIIQNPDPIPLDVSGAPSNGSTQTGIWLANTAYKFCAYDAAMVLQWCTDNVTGYLGLLNLPNVWSFQQTFSLPIVDTATGNQLVFGNPGNQTTADFPPPSGNITLHFPNTADTMVGRNTTDTLTNKTLNSSVLITPSVGQCTMQNGFATYVCIANANPTGTIASSLVKLANAPSQAIIPAISDTAGVIGICVLNCGTASIATIQQSGAVRCNFDNAVVAGDYVQISSSVAGKCTDVGASFPSSGQVLGRALESFGSPGAFLMDLFPENSASGVKTICATAQSVNVNANTTSLQAMASCSFPAGSLNALGKAIRITFGGSILPNTAINSTFAVASGTTGSLGGSTSNLTSQTASASPMTATTQLTCVVRVAGALGFLSCIPLNLTSGAGSPTASVSTFTLANLDFTSTLFLGPACSFSVASVSNICTLSELVVEQLN